MSTLSLSQKIAAWVGAFDLPSAPPDVIHQTKLRILDIVGAMLGGRDTDLIAQVSAATFVPENGVGTPVIGFGKQTGAAHAALLQGTMACVLEYDDSHVATGIHASSPVVAAAIAVGQQKAISGPALIEAVLIGNETACRLGLAAPGAFHRVGFHPTGVIAVFGAGYAVSRLARLKTGQLVNAIGICGSFSSGIMASWEDGTSAKSLHAGWAASSAIQAVQLARHGVSGPATAYEGRFGFYRAHVQTPGYAFDFDACAGQLGERWEVLNIAPRAYPCGHYIQPFIDAALHIVRDHAIAVNEIEEVVCLVADYMVPLICEPAAEKIRPATSWHARYSLPFCIAECLLTRGFDKHSLAAKDLDDERYTALCRRIAYRVDPAASANRGQWSGEVQLTLRGGRQFHHRVEHMHGTPENPMTEAELIAKFLHNTSGVLPADKSEQIVDRILHLEDEDDIRAMLRPLCADKL
jgi:2-methylcitrate dehydratase PrpD